jgi:hypothetical protein
MPEFIEVLATIVQHGDEMAKEYQRVFGKPIQLSRGVKNAGYEWILRMLKNDAIIAGSTNDVSNAVGQPGQAKPPVGITAFSRLRDKEKNPKLVFDVSYDTKPVMGFATEVIVAIANRAKHPNAAKLMTADDGRRKGGQGYKPYFVLGNTPYGPISQRPGFPDARADEHLDGRRGLCLGPRQGDPRFLAGEPEITAFPRFTHEWNKPVRQPSGLKLRQPQVIWGSSYDGPRGTRGGPSATGPRHGRMAEADRRISRSASRDLGLFHLRVFASPLSVNIFYRPLIHLATSLTIP